MPTIVSEGRVKGGTHSENPVSFLTFRFSTKEDCHRFLKEGFTPYFLCCPDFHKDGLAYLVFTKLDEGYWRMIRSSNYGGFYSTGGGKADIHNLIYSMLDLDIPYSEIHAVTVKQKEWENLLHGCWYNKEMIGYSGAANFDAIEIFISWYKEAYKLKSRWPET
jgi:hypothetical protein